MFSIFHSILAILCLIIWTESLSQFLVLLGPRILLSPCRMAWGRQGRRLPVFFAVFVQRSELKREVEKARKKKTVLLKGEQYLGSRS